MRDYQSEKRARRRMPIRPPGGVVFLDEEDAQPEAAESGDGTRGSQWRTRAALVGLLAMVLIIGLVTRNAGFRAKRTSSLTIQSAASPPLICGSMSRVPVSDLLIAITRTTTRALPGIQINDAVVRVACLVHESRDPRFHVVGAPPSLLTRSLDARYKQLLIGMQISPGKPSRPTTMQTVASGASNAYIIHNRRRSARRTVTVTVIAPQHARIPVLRLHRMADELARLPGLESRTRS